MKILVQDFLLILPRAGVMVDIVAVAMEETVEIITAVSITPLPRQW
jgi:hypothetical protein